MTALAKLLRLGEGRTLRALTAHAADSNATEPEISRLTDYSGPSHTR